MVNDSDNSKVPGKNKGKSKDKGNNRSTRFPYDRKGKGKGQDKDKQSKDLDKGKPGAGKHDNEEQGKDNSKQGKYGKDFEGKGEPILLISIVPSATISSVDSSCSSSPAEFEVVPPIPHTTPPLIESRTPSTLTDEEGQAGGAS